VDLSAIGIVGFGALGVLVVLWLVISFSAPSPRRETVEWLAATCLYVALSALFLNLVLRAHDSGNVFALVAFAFLGVIFVCGGCIAVFNVIRSLGSGGSSGPQASATN
jgi:hypothetical protein